jgi:hypothetical protein
MSKPPDRALQTESPIQLIKLIRLLGQLFVLMTILAGLGIWKSCRVQNSECTVAHLAEWATTDLVSLIYVSAMFSLFIGVVALVVIERVRRSKN